MISLIILTNSRNNYEQLSKIYDLLGKQNVHPTEVIVMVEDDKCPKVPNATFVTGSNVKPLQRKAALKYAHYYPVFWDDASSLYHEKWIEKFLQRKAFDQIERNQNITDPKQRLNICQNCEHLIKGDKWKCNSMCKCSRQDLREMVTEKNKRCPKYKWKHKNQQVIVKKR